MEGDLQKQRRNLLVVSVLLIIQAVAEVDISKISLLGTELKTEKVGVLLGCFWILWIYFLLRYYQYWREGDHFTEFRQKVALRKQTLLNHWAQREVIKKLGEDRRGDWRFATDLNGEGLSLLLDRYVEGKLVSEFYTVPGYVHLLTQIRAVNWVSVQTTETTEHFLPFALALLAPVVALAIGWKEMLQVLTS